MNYRRAFLGAVAVCAVLLAALGYAVLHRGKLTTLAAATAQAVDPTDPVVARGPEAASSLEFRQCFTFFSRLRKEHPGGIPLPQCCSVRGRHGTGVLRRLVA